MIRITCDRVPPSMSCLRIVAPTPVGLGTEASQMMTPTQPMYPRIVVMTAAMSSGISAGWRSQRVPRMP